MALLLALLNINNIIKFDQQELTRLINLVDSFSVSLSLFLNCRAWIMVSQPVDHREFVIEPHNRDR